MAAKAVQFSISCDLHDSERSSNSESAAFSDGRLLSRNTVVCRSHVR
jgi:hypothetical protein